MRVHAWSAGEVRHLERIVRRDGSLRMRTLPARFGIIEHPHGPVVFDTGYHPSLRERLHGAARAYHRVVPWQCTPRQTVGSRLRQLGYAPSDAQMVVLSHLHADHLAGLVDLPDVPIVLSRPSWEALRGPGRIRLALQGYFAELLPPDLERRAVWVEPTTPQSTLEDSALDVLGDGSLGVVSLPGHAPGQIGLWVRRTTGPNVLFIADASFSLDAVFSGSTPSRVFMRMVHDDARATERTLHHLQRWHRADPDLRLIPCHAWEGPPDGEVR